MGRFWKVGYELVRGVYSEQEMYVIKAVVNRTKSMANQLAHISNLVAQGQHPSFVTLFGFKGDERPPQEYIQLQRSHRVLQRLACYYQDQVYGFHNKIVLKYSGGPGFRPHQDHHYWRSSGLRFPETSATFIAVDEAT